MHASRIQIRKASKKIAPLGFTPSELRTLRGLKTPAGIQRFLDNLPYHLAGTAWSPRLVLRERTAHCLEGAIFAAAALRVLGFPPLQIGVSLWRKGSGWDSSITMMFLSPTLSFVLQSGCRTIVMQI